jgi:Nuclease-related domain
MTSWPESAPEHCPITAPPLPTDCPTWLNSRFHAADTASVAYEVDRRPGEWVREQTARRERRIWIGLAVGFLVTGAFMALAIGRHVSIAASAGFLTAVLLVRPYVEGYVDRHVRLRSGTRAEVAVGETLEQLRRDGWIVMHDIERPSEANLDHVVSGPNGVFLIETKDLRYEDLHLARVKGQAAWLHDQLGVWVTPVICIRARRGRPFRTRGVWVVPLAELLDWLRAQRNAPVKFERLARFADSL